MTAQGFLAREFHDDDLEAVVHLWDETKEEQPSVFSLAECVTALTDNQPAVVAVSDGKLIGAALASIHGERAWVMRISVHPTRRGEGIPSTLLEHLERLLVDQHTRRIAYVLPHEELVSNGLATAGYRRQDAVAYYEKREGLGPREAALLSQLGGRILPGDLWRKLVGMREEKLLIENRVIAPLANAEVARDHGVQPPHGLMLFGPPGTGKTSFARAIASRLGWPFVEIFPSRLASREGGLAQALRDTFGQIAALEQVVVFIDEVEEIAPRRFADRERTEAHGVVNEMLKIIPSFRERDRRLLVCATNSIGSLDPAFLRPGRFDYVIPIGPPDDEARAAMWQSHIERSGREDIGIDTLVQISETFTPADVDHAARAAAQSAFEREVVHGQRPDERGATEADYLAAIKGIRPTLTAEAVASFHEDIAVAARL